MKTAMNNKRVAAVIEGAMNAQGIGIRDMALKTEITYEHIRRVVRGESVPSRFILKMICDVLGLDYKELDKLATADKIEKKYGGVPAEISGKDPSLQPVENVWKKLNETQRDSLLAMANALAKQNRA